MKLKQHNFPINIKNIYLYPSATVHYDSVTFGVLNVDVYVGDNDVEGIEQTERQGR